MENTMLEENPITVTIPTTPEVKSEKIKCDDCLDSFDADSLHEVMGGDRKVCNSCKEDYAECSQCVSMIH